MKVIFKIAEEQRKSEKGMKQLFNYIYRDKAVYKTCGVGVPDEKKLAVDLFMINKKRFKKDVDEKFRFLEHSIITFEAGTDKDLIYKICEEFCEEAYLEKGFNSFFVIHEDKDNPHAHILTDNVNFITGNMLTSLTEKQYKSSDKKRQEKIEVVVYEQRRELIQDICIRNGYEIDEKEKYKYMHQQKVKEGRTWLKKNEFRTIKDEKSWRNIIKNKLEEIYNREDLKEDNIQDIAKEYGLQVTRHNTDKKSITFALVDEKGNPSKKERIKLERLKEQEQELLLRDDKTKTNIFEYDIFFRGREKEEEKTREETIKIEAPDDSHTELESDSKTYNINKTNERNYIVDNNEDKEKEKDKKDFEKEKEYKNKIEDFYEKQEEIKKNKIEAQKKLDEQIKTDEKNKLNKLDEANETLRRLSIEEIERQKIEKKLKEARKYLFNELKDFKVIIDELEILDKEKKIKYTEYNLYNYNNAVVQVFESLVNKIEFNNTEEEERGKKIVKNVYLFSDKTSIKESLEALDELILDNKRYKEEKVEAPDNSYTELGTDTKTYNTYEEEKIEAPDDSHTELGTDSTTYNTSYEEEKIEAPDNSYTELGTDSTTYNTSYKEEKIEAPDIDKILKNIDLYEIVKTNKIFDILPHFTIYNQDGTLLYNSETEEINHSEASDYVKDSKGEEYWDNMNFKDIKQWSAIETLIVVCGEEEYKGYEDYAEKTIKNFLKNNLDIAKALDNDKTLISNDKEEIKLNKREDKEIDFN
jgi:exonuclease SbcC